jgi:cytochrome c peroxidase
VTTRRSLATTLAASLALLPACGDVAASGADAGAADAGSVTPPEDAYPLTLPTGYPRPAIPADEPLSRPRVELGRHLFHDRRLSANGTQSCASCHVQSLAFTDGLAASVGSTGEAHFRNAMSLTNVGYSSALTWASPILGSLAEQALIPMFGEFPVELGLAGGEEALLARLRAEPRYERLFLEAFGAEPDPFTVRNVVVALAAFERTLISYRSPYDRATYGGDASALDDSARRGLALFFEERFDCFHCHGGFNFSQSTRHDGTAFDETEFHNTGLYDVDGRGSYPATDTGIARVTSDPLDMGRFRAPTLRNIALTAPYFHDGSAATLDDVLDHYARGGRLIESGPNAGDGANNPFKSPFVRPIAMTAQERADLLAFLRALTDEEFVRDPRHADPW